MPDTVLSTLYVLTLFNPHDDPEIGMIFIITIVFSIVYMRDQRWREDKSLLQVTVSKW